jgi:hypothetical protein
LTKRHTKQNSKQSLGQYFTTNSDRILEGFEYLVHEKKVLDPFAGAWDLLNWANRNGAVECVGYDIEPRTAETYERDSLLNPVDYTGYLVLANPPYLSSNKSKGKYKDIYKRWGQSDLYKCFLASLARCNANEAIVIIPSNFLCESNPTARSLLFADYDVKFAKFWQEQVFDDATTGVCILHLIRRDGLNNGVQKFDCRLLPNELIVTMDLSLESNYLHGGKELFSLRTGKTFERVTTETLEANNTNILVSCIDGGKNDLGFHYNDSSPLRVPSTVITNFQVNTVGFLLTQEEQHKIIDVANQNLRQMRSKYHSMFLSNYMGATQKIMSVSIAKAFLSDAVHTTLDN